MGLIGRLKAIFAADEDAQPTEPNTNGGEYVCTSCGSVFTTARERCPQCGGSTLTQRDHSEFRPGS